MSKQFPELDQPLNANERYLHACAVRLDALCHMLSSLIEHIAERDNVATTSNKVDEKPHVQTEQKAEVVEEKPKKKPTRKK